MNNEKLISPYIASQFPAHYRENYPQFIEFVKMYYSWLEQGDQAVGHARRLQEYRDIDETPEDYILYFKTKYLPYIKFITEVDKRTLVKHVLDLYRSKGTERGVDLFFKLVYGVPADVYYPSTDLFRLSDNIWIKRNYLEIGHIELISQYTGKKIIGTRSGATAFAERFIQKKVGKKYINILFISNVVGDFMFNEKLTYDGLADSDTKRPKVIGSLSRLDVTTGSKDFSIGDVVGVSSEHGYGALARVSNVYNTSGLVDFTLIDGGWGYTQAVEGDQYLTGPVVYVSDKIMTIQDVTVDYTSNNPDEAPYVASPYFTLEKVYQPLANLDYKFDTSRQSVLVNKPASAWYAVGATLYQTNGSVNTSVGVVISNSSVNTSAQNLVIRATFSNIFFRDFTTTSGNFGNLVLSTNSSVNSSVLTTNTSTNIYSIEVGTVLSSYNSTGGVISSVEVLNNDISDITQKTANLFVYVISGNAATNSYFWGPSNTFSINVQTVVDKTATGNVVAFGNTLTMYVSNSSTIFSADQYLTQRKTYAGGYDISAKAKITGVAGVTNTFIIQVADSTGVFRKNVNVYMQYANGSESGQTAYLRSYDGVLGVANIQNDFVSTGSNKIFTRGWTLDANSQLIIYGSNSVANLVLLSSGKNATFSTSNTLAYAESYSLYTDFIGANNEANVPYMDLNISNSTAFSNSLTLTFAANVEWLAVSGGTTDINLATNWYVCGAGLSDFTEIVSKNTTHIQVTPNTWSSSSGTYRLTPTTGIEWNFPLNQAGTFQFILEDVLNAINGYVGGITKLTAINPGEDYNLAPMVLIREPYTAGFAKKDYILTCNNTAGNFQLGEQIGQDNGARGLIKQIDAKPNGDKILYVRRQNLPIGNSATSFITEFTVGGSIEGFSAGANSTIVGIDEDDSALGIGLNAIVRDSVVAGNGVVSGLDILSSGFGFKNFENATFTSEDGMRIGTAKVNLIKQGVTDGSYSDESSFLSSSKYLFDGYYYQEYSYDIKTSIPRESYYDNYNATMHMSGTKMFSTYVHVSENDVALSISLPEGANLIANTV
jgi:hypothetical protein